MTLSASSRTRVIAERSCRAARTMDVYTIIQYNYTYHLPYLWRPAVVWRWLYPPVAGPKLSRREAAGRPAPWTSTTISLHISLALSLETSSCLTMTLSASSRTRVIAERSCRAARTMDVFSVKDLGWPWSLAISTEVNLCIQPPENSGLVEHQCAKNVFVLKIYPHWQMVQFENWACDVNEVWTTFRWTYNLSLVTATLFNFIYCITYVSQMKLEWGCPNGTKYPPRQPIPNRAILPNRARVYRRTDRQTDRQTDGRTGWFQYTPPNFVAGGYNYGQTDRWIIDGWIDIKTIQTYLFNLEKNKMSLWNTMSTPPTSRQWSPKNLFLE